MSPVRINPSPGSQWQMRTGIVTVVGIANDHKQPNADYPRTVVYRTAAGELECRSLSRFRTAAVAPVSCQARRENDEMVCFACRKRWDVSDPQPCAGAAP